MESYVAYLRAPRSRPLTIAQFNREHGALLDADADFQHACLVAWHEGCLQRQGRPSVALTNTFPNAPRLRSAAPVALSAAHFDVSRWGRPAARFELTSARATAMRNFVSDPARGVPRELAGIVSGCGSAAVEAFLERLDRGQTTTLRCPALV